MLGYSRGTISACNFTHTLRQATTEGWYEIEAAIPVKTLVTLDPETGGPDEPRGASSNVTYYYNFWQGRGAVIPPANSIMRVYQNGNYVYDEDMGTPIGAILRGDELDSAAQNTVQVRIDTDRANTLVRHQQFASVRPDLEGEMPGENVNHDTVPW